MAWIKVLRETPGKPEISLLARHLGVSRGDAFLSFFRLYAWADEETEDGFFPLLSAQDVDDSSQCLPGTCEILSRPEIGWIVIKEDGVRFVRFGKHNGKSAKARAKEAERKSIQRGDEEMSGFCPDSVPEKTGQKPDKNRTSSLSYSYSLISGSLKDNVPENLRSDSFLAAFRDWVKHRQEIRKPLTETQTEKQLARFSKWGEARSVAAIEHTIAMGWQGLREPETQNGNGKLTKEERIVESKRLFEEREGT